MISPNTAVYLPIILIWILLMYQRTMSFTKNHKSIHWSSDLVFVFLVIFLRIVFMVITLIVIIVRIFFASIGIISVMVLMWLVRLVIIAWTSRSWWRLSWSCCSNLAR